MSDSGRIPTNLRTLLIMEAFSEANSALTAAEIGRSIGLAKPTAHRLCQSLEAEGFLVRQTGSKRFQPARRARSMAGGLLYAASTHIARHQVLEELAREVGETVNFVVPAETGMRYLDRVETDWPFRVQFGVGSDVPFHCTASGKTFMASLAPRARRTFVSALNLERHTRHTHATTETLLEDLEEIAERGYALDKEEFIEGMVAIAVPVFNPEGRFAAALAFHGPKNRVSLETALARKDLMIEGAHKLGIALFSD